MNETDSSGLAALRALYEGAAPQIGLLARAARRSEAGLRRLAERQGWHPAGQGGEGSDLQRRLLVLSDRLVGELERASEEGARHGAYDKGRIDALSAMLRMVEKISEKARGSERAREDQTASDEEMAAALERIDARIRALARELAGSLGAGGGEGMGAAQPAGAAVDGD